MKKVLLLVTVIVGVFVLALCLVGDKKEYKNDGYYNTTREEFEFQIDNAYENTDRFYKLLKRGGLSENEVDFISTVLDLNINSIKIVALEEGTDLRGRFLDYAYELRELISMDINKLNEKLNKKDIGQIEKYRKNFLKEYKKFEKEGKGRKMIEEGK